MLDLDTLDTIIAVVVVLLLLSLIVQSIQAAIKKVLRIKSKQIEDSLIDLFENVLEQPPEKHTRWYNNSPFIRTITRAGTPEDHAHGDVQKLYGAVMERFRQLGRIAQGGSRTLESVSKEDLSKVIATVDLEEFLPNARQKFKAVCATVSEIRKLFDEIDAVRLTGQAQVEWAKLQAQVSPLLNDVAQLFDADKNDFNRTLVVRHVLELRNADISSVTTVLGSVRAQLAGDPALTGKIDAVIAKLASIPRVLDEALAPIRARVAAVETWYDTVMQSFDERYTRAMRTWSFFIGLLVAVVLNANIFDLYRRLATDDVARQMVIAAAPEIDRTQPAALDQLKDIHDELEKNADQYLAFGFQPIWVTAHQIGDAPGGWPGAIIGWLLMALLLNLGAPFWHDALSSLFGVKNLLQQRTGTKTSEQRSGEGARA